MLLLQAFKNSDMIPWEVRNRWLNCIELIKGMIFIVTHILREGNVCVDDLANIRLDINGFFWWQDAPICIRHDVVKNMLGLPNFRFTTF